MTATMFNQNAEITRRISELAKTRDTLQLLTNLFPQVVVVANDDKLDVVDSFNVSRTSTGTTAITTVATAPSQVWITGFSLQMALIGMLLVSEAEITAVINGQTKTIGKIEFPNVALNAGNDSDSITMSLTHPIRVDAASVINLVIVNGAAAAVATATVHTVTNKL